MPHPAASGPLPHDGRSRRMIAGRNPRGRDEHPPACPPRSRSPHPFAEGWRHCLKISLYRYTNEDYNLIRTRRSTIRPVIQPAANHDRAASGAKPEESHQQTLHPPPTFQTNRRIFRSFIPCDSNSAPPVASCRHRNGAHRRHLSWREHCCKLVRLYFDTPSHCC